MITQELCLVPMNELTPFFVAASTQPGDGGKSYVPSATVEYVEPSASSTEGKIPWKDQVLGAYMRHILS